MLSLPLGFVCGGCLLNGTPSHVMIPLLPKALNHDHHLSPSSPPPGRANIYICKKPLQPKAGGGSSVYTGLQGLNGKPQSKEVGDGTTRMRPFDGLLKVRLGLLRLLRTFRIRLRTSKHLPGFHAQLPSPSAQKGNDDIRGPL